MRISDWSSDVCSSDRSAAASAEADDAALFGALWPLGETVKLDATVVRRWPRQQRDRLDKLGYEFAPLSQDEIGREPGREGVGQYGLMSGVAVPLQKKQSEGNVIVKTNE